MSRNPSLPVARRLACGVVAGWAFAATPAGATDGARPGGPEAIAPAPAVERTRPATALDVHRLKRRGSPESRSTNAFAPRSWVFAPPPAPAAPTPAVVVTPPPPPAPPQAPPLPFKYLGMLKESESRTVWYLLHGDRLVVAALGDIVDSVYRIEEAPAGQLLIRYLPLDQRQALSIGGTP